MVVWDLPDAQVDALGQRIGALPFVTLCYRRPRRPPEWPYNLFTMIHGRDRAAVLSQVAQLKADLETELGPLINAVLFSGQRFKQRGAFYRTASTATEPSARVDLAPGWQPDLAGRGEAGGEGQGKELRPLSRPQSQPQSQPQSKFQAQTQAQPKPKPKPKPSTKSKVMGIFHPNPLVTMEPPPGSKPSPNTQAPAVSYPAWTLNLGRELPA